MQGHTFKRILLVSTAAASWLALPVQLKSQVKPPETVVIKGAPMGGVKLLHSLHSQRVESKCEVCHHPSKPEKPNKSPQQACTECHTKPLQAGMKTGRQAGFHNSTARSGICVDCHTRENANGKKAPLRCPECHKKENI